MAANNSLIAYVYLCLSIMSITIFFILVHKYLKDKNKSSSAHTITKILALLTLFLFIDSLYNFLLCEALYGIFPIRAYLFLSSPIFELMSNMGILISVIIIAHFIMEGRIEEFVKNETTLRELHSLNQELEHKTKELSNSQETLQKKIHELERFNEIAKEREGKMINLIKKIEKLEGKLKNTTK